MSSLYAVSYTHLDVYKRQEEGVAKKRNLGLENATGDYIYFIDSDDYIMPQTLSCLLQDAMQKDLDLVVGRRWITWFKKQVFETMGDEKNEELNLKDKDCLLYTSVFLILIQN